MSVQKAYVLAEEMHKGQTDKAGQPFIGHPVRVAQITKELGGNEFAQQAALLHDIIEDTPMTMEDLKEYGFHQEVLDILYYVTRDYHLDVNYIGWITRIKESGNEGAIIVKTADTTDNLDLKRYVPNVGLESLYKKYRKGIAILKG